MEEKSIVGNYIFDYYTELAWHVNGGVEIADDQGEKLRLRLEADSSAHRRNQRISWIACQVRLSSIVEAYKTPYPKLISTLPQCFIDEEPLYTAIVLLHSSHSNKNLKMRVRSCTRVMLI